MSRLSCFVVVVCCVLLDAVRCCRLVLVVVCCRCLWFVGVAVVRRCCSLCSFVMRCRSRCFAVCCAPVVSRCYLLVRVNYFSFVDVVEG